MVQDVIPDRKSSVGGAYGLTISGVPDARALLIDAPSHWPGLELVISDTPGPPTRGEYVNAHTAIVRLRAGGWVYVDRAASRAVFSLPSPPTDAALVHPHLAAAAVVHAHWSQRESFHAGAVVIADGVWGLLGERHAGKSSVLASLACGGLPVMCDDVLVLDGSLALAGPRSIDLRAGAATQLGAGEALGLIGGRERWRMRLDGVAAELPFRGWVELGWGPGVSVTAVRGSDRLQTLLGYRGLGVVPTRPERLIHLAGLPMLAFRRPRRWELHERAIGALLEAIRAVDQPGGLQQRE